MTLSYERSEPASRSLPSPSRSLRWEFSRFLRAIIIVIAPAALLAAGPMDAASDAEIETIIRLRIASAVLETFGDETGSCPLESAEIRRLEDVLTSALPKPYQAHVVPYDAWGNPLYFVCRDSESLVISPGPDGLLGAQDEITDLLQNPHGSNYRAKTIDGDDIIAHGRLILKRSQTHRESQKQSMAAIRAIGVAVEEFAIENGRYPGSAGEFLLVMRLRDELKPYIKDLPIRDAWDTELRYWSNSTSYLIVSMGADREFDRPYRKMQNPEVEIGDHGHFSNPDQDIIFYNGMFVRWPRGMSPY